MTYEPKVGDEVVFRGTVLEICTGCFLRVTFRDDDDRYVWMRKSLAEPVARDLGEAEMRGNVTGPWAVALSEALEKIEKRVAEIEASAKVRDVPATMVNLASRVQGLEVTVKTMIEDAREKDARVAAELDGVLVRVGRLEEKLQSGSVRIGSRLAALEDWQGVQQLNWPLPPSDKPRGHGSWAADADEIRDAQGRVLKSRMQDVDPQGDWNTATTANLARGDHLKGARSGKDYITTSIPYLQSLIVENNTLRADVKRLEKIIRGDP